MTRGTAAACALAVLVALPACERGEPDDRPSRTERRIDRELDPGSPVPVRDGLAAAILIDVSGSMGDSVEGEDGREARKIDIARRAAQDLVEQFVRYARDHPGEPVLLGLYEFSDRSGQPDSRPIVPMSAPDPERARAALAALRARGGTPIGNAMIAAKRELDTAGLSRRHLLVVTDGENTDGFRPDQVAAAIGRRPMEEQPSMYFVAFDIEARRFTRARDAGVLVLGAANARQLNDTLDTLLRGSILVEK